MPAVAQGARSALAAPGGGTGQVCVGGTSKLATDSAVTLLRAGRPPKLSVELPMPSLPQSLLDEVSAVLIEAGRLDLAERLVSFGHPEALTSGQAAKALGLSSATTVKNWLAGGHFPGAYRTAGGHWRCSADEVEAVRAGMEELARRNREGELAPPELGGDDEGPPLL